MKIFFLLIISFISCSVYAAKESYCKTWLQSHKYFVSKNAKWVISLESSLKATIEYRPAIGVSFSGNADVQCFDSDNLVSFELSGGQLAGKFWGEFYFTDNSKHIRDVFGNIEINKKEVKLPDEFVEGEGDVQ